MSITELILWYQNFSSANLLIKECNLKENLELSGTIKVPSHMATWLSPNGSVKKHSLYNKHPSACGESRKKQKNTWTKLTWEKCHFSHNWRSKFLNFTVKQNSWSCGWTEHWLAGWYPPLPLLRHKCDLHRTEQDTHRWYLNYCSAVAPRVLAATRSVIALACFVNIVTIKDRCIYTSTLHGKHAPFFEMKHWC